MNRVPVLIAAIVIAACGDSTEPSPHAVGATTGDGVVLEVTRSGGLCVDGECSTTWTVMANGEVDLRESGAFDIVVTQLEPADLEALVDAVATGPGLLPPFTGTCPAAYDGPRYTYQLGATTVDSCTSDVRGSELILLIHRVLALDAAYPS